MHESLEVKIHELIEDGEEHRVQWGKLLESFSGLELKRIVIALESLNPNQLDSISDGITRARERAKYKSIESIKATLIKEGIKVSDFLSHLGVSLSGDMVAKVDKPTREKPRTNNRLSKEGKKALDELLISGQYSASKACEKLFAMTGESANPATAYAARARLRKEGKMS